MVNCDRLTHLVHSVKILLYGKGRNSYRILFTILDIGEVHTVRILHVRHSSQQSIGENPEEPDGG